jgi:hypothetical protein
MTARRIRQSFQAGRMVSDVGGIWGLRFVEPLGLLRGSVARFTALLSKRAVLMPSTPFAYSHVISRRFAYFRVVGFDIFAGQRHFRDGFDSRQLHYRLSLEPIMMSF